MRNNFSPTSVVLALVVMVLVTFATPMNGDDKGGDYDGSVIIVNGDKPTTTPRESMICTENTNGCLPPGCVNFTPTVVIGMNEYKSGKAITNYRWGSCTERSGEGPCQQVSVLKCAQLYFYGVRDCAGAAQAFDIYIENACAFGK